MAGVNKVILIGNLGRDPELRYTQNGQAVVNFSLATSENWKDSDGERQERTEWHRIVAWGRTGELCAQYLSKGRTVYIEGRLQTRDWEDREGNKRTTTEINAQTVQFLGGPRGSGDQGPGYSGPPGGGGGGEAGGGGGEAGGGGGGGEAGGGGGEAGGGGGEAGGGGEGGNVGGGGGGTEPAGTAPSNPDGEIPF